MSYFILILISTGARIDGLVIFKFILYWKRKGKNIIVRVLCDLRWWSSLYMCMWNKTYRKLCTGSDLSNLFISRNATRWIFLSHFSSQKKRECIFSFGLSSTSYRLCRSAFSCLFFLLYNFSKKLNEVKELSIILNWKHSAAYIHTYIHTKIVQKRKYKLGLQFISLSLSARSILVLVQPPKNMEDFGKQYGNKQPHRTPAAFDFACVQPPVSRYV